MEKWVKQRVFSEGIAAVMDNSGKWGFVDEEGNEVCPCKWNNVGDFKEGFAWIADDNYMCGLINKSGEIVVTPKFHSIWCKDGLLHIAADDNHWGLATTKGKIITRCLWKEDISPINLTGDLFRIKDQNDMYGIMDWEGNIISSCQWIKVYNQKNGLINVVNKDLRHGFIDNKGNQVYPCSIPFSSFINDDLSSFVDEMNNIFEIKPNGSVVKRP